MEKCFQGWVILLSLLLYQTRRGSVPDHLNVGEYSSNDHLIKKKSACAEQPETTEPDDALLNRISLNQMTTRRWSMEEDIKAVTQLGLKSVGLWRLKYEDYGETETANLLNESQLNVSSISWIGGFTGAHGYIIDDCIREAVEVIRFAKWIGAETVVIATGEQDRHIVSYAQKLVAESLELLGDYAQECNVQLAVMPMTPSTAHGWTFLTSLQKTEELLARCNHPNVGLCLHSYYALQDTKWKQILPRLVSDIKLVKLCDGASPKRPRKQCLPGQGKMDLSILFESLLSLGYEGMFEIDTWCEQHWKTNQTDQLQTSLKWMKDWLPVPSAR